MAGTGNISVNKTDRVPHSHGSHVLLGKDNKLVNGQIYLHYSYNYDKNK